MRLEKIKLVGFKSFVDPTTVDFPSNLTGVVGPNGCGKSNVIDAIKWVMGESSAKQLRGDSITDVIFNGTTERKPVNQASVELIFDNQDGRIAGAYAQYSEVSIKRIVTREAQSTYYLNGTKCRRRDIVDILLGTGLGPRSYSIIQQGMISTLIEAKPEELRNHLEEVSGISKYKERRRETENRIKHTKENLARLNDLREEVDKQLSHLKRQASAAERYTVLKNELNLLKSQRLVRQWEQLNTSVLKADQIQQTFQVDLEKEQAALSHNEAETTKTRELIHDTNETHSTVQSQYYGLGADISRIENAINHFKERQSQLTEDYAQTETAWQSAKTHLTQDQTRLSELETRIADITPRHVALTTSSDATNTQLQTAQTNMQDWQETWDQFLSDSQSSSETAQVEQTKIQHIEENQFNTKRRLEAIVAEERGLDISQPEADLQALKQSLELLEQDRDAQQAELARVIDSLKTARETQQSVTTTLDDLKGKLQEARGRYASLEALQQEALGKQSDQSVSWLSAQGLSDSARMAESITVDQGWEKAAEAVLGKYLEAVCVDDMASFAANLAGFEGEMTLFDVSHAALAGARQSMPSLARKVKGPESVLAMLESVYVADSLTEALQLRTSLEAHESVVCKEGICLGKSWLRVANTKDSRTGVIQREQTLKTLKANIEQLEEAMREAQANLDAAHDALQTLESQREVKQSEVNESRQNVSEQQTKQKVKEARLEQAKYRIQKLREEADSLREEMGKASDELQTARTTWQGAMDTMENNANQRESLLTERDEKRSTLETAQTAMQTARDQLHQAELELRSAQTESTNLTASLARTQEQSEHLAQRFEQLKEALSHGDSPLESMNADLKTALEKRSEVEKQLTEVKQTLSLNEHQQRELEKQRHELEQAIQSVREKLESQKLQSQENRVRSKTIEEQLQAEGVNLEEVQAQLTDELTMSHLDESLQRTETRISRLGPINLAAIDEFKTQSERKIYLDAQNDDLVEALTTLETAIKKIDKETRQRFKETYDTVNENFQKFFPKIFGGGNAYLELTGEDLLDTGIAVIARPPGKKNSTIHLLSGGEKALTAIALVFSLFQVNPAPFCMLDEVDAPLDDANVSRYCRVVEEMSSKVQFIFISHNKVAMEMANHLTGVTMHEPGVSRIVSVDMAEAVAMAEE
jgi:chromosome segregation protein